MECTPKDSLEVESVALPPLKAAVPNEVAPSKNCTVPVAADRETVAVNVTFCPVFDGLGLDVKVVVVLALFTVCVSAADVLPV